MKNIILYSITFLLLLSCSSDDTSENIVNYNYFPIKSQNNWSYTATGMGASNSTSTISNTATTVDGLSFYQLSNPQNIFGSQSNPTYVRRDGNLYYLSGSVIFGTQNIAINNQKFLDESATVGQTINDFSYDEISDPINFAQGTISGTYTITTTFRFVIKVLSKGAATVNVQNYSNTIKQQWNIYVASKIHITSGIASTTHQLLNESQLATLTQTFAENVGDVQSNIVIDGSQISFNNTISLLGQTMNISSLTTPIQAQINAMQDNRTYTISSFTLF